MEDGEWVDRDAVFEKSRQEKRVSPIGNFLQPSRKKIQASSINSLLG
jgi:hypothetical protein